MRGFGVRLSKPGFLKMEIHSGYKETPRVPTRTLLVPLIGDIRSLIVGT